MTCSPELCDQKRAKSKLGNLINGSKPSRSYRDQNLLGKEDLQGCQHQHIILIRIKDVSSFFHDLRATENIIKRLCAYTVHLKRICKHLFCATLNFFSRGSFDSVIFLKRASVLPLCFDLTAVCVYVGSKNAKRRTIKQPPPT